jgi:hypothetical protein
MTTTESEGGGPYVCGLTLAMGCGNDLSQSREKPLLFLVTWQMRVKLFDAVAISPELGAVAAHHREQKALPLNDLDKAVQHFDGIDSCATIQYSHSYING